MRGILGCNGGNDYKKEHIHKDKMIREGIFPEVLSLDEDIVNESMDSISDLTYNAGQT